MVDHQGFGRAEVAWSRNQTTDDWMARRRSLGRQTADADLAHFGLLPGPESATRRTIDGVSEFQYKTVGLPDQHVLQKLARIWSRKHMMAIDVEQRPLRVTIIGAGIAGLTAALALRKQGHVVTVGEGLLSVMDSG